MTVRTPTSATTWFSIAGANAAPYLRSVPERAQSAYLQLIGSIMFGIVSFWAFIVGTTLTAIVPGANTYRVLDFSFRYGIRGGVWSSAGVVLADLTFMIAAALGLASLMTLFPFTYGILLLLGGIYFLNMSIAVLKSPFESQHKFGDSDRIARDPSALRGAFSQSYATCLSNFKAIFFYTLFFPKFIDPNFRPAWVPFVLLCATVLVILVIYYSALSLIGVALFSSKVGTKIFSFINFGFGIFVGILSISLFYEFYKFVAERVTWF